VARYFCAARAAGDEPAMTEPDFEFDRDGVVVCMVIAFCLGNAALSVIYRLMT
jgi:hypothetical protein